MKFAAQLLIYFFWRYIARLRETTADPASIIAPI